MRRLVPPGVALGLLLACGSEVRSPPSMPTVPPTADPRLVVVPGPATGPTTITFVSADPSPGAVVAGCGSDAGGCRGRVRMAFRLAPSATGSALRFLVFLHAPSKRACLLASNPPFSLRAGESMAVAVVFDDSDPCATPFEIATMAAVVEGTVEVASRQEWSVHYSFTP